MDFIIRNALLSGHGEAPLDIGIERGRIAAIERNLAADAPSYDAHGKLACPGLIESHIHLDKARIIDRCAPQERATLSPVFGVTPVKKTMTVEDVHARAAQTLEECIKHGTTRMRTQVEVDPGIGMRGFEGVEALIAEYKWAIDIEMCVFPQEGLISYPGTDELLVEGLKRGAKVIGGAPRYDKDGPGQIRRIFELAREYRRRHRHASRRRPHRQRHVHPSGARADRPVQARRPRGRRPHGQAVVAAARRDGGASPAQLADSGVAVTVLPATDLFLMGRDQDHSVRRGVADANVLCAHGVKCSLSTNNVLNPATPYGDCSLIRIANLYANVLQVDRPAHLRECFEMLTERSARLLNYKDYGFAVGNPADVVIINATTPEQAVAEIAQPLAAFKNGRQTMTWNLPELVRPN